MLDKKIWQDADKDQMTLTFLQNYLGLMKIPVTWRTNVKDELFVYALTQNLSPPAQNFVSLIAETYLMWDYIIRTTTLIYCEMFVYSLTNNLCPPSERFTEKTHLFKWDSVYRSTVCIVWVILQEKNTN